MRDNEIEDILLKQKILSQDRIDIAKKAAQKKGLKLELALVHNNFLTEDRLIEAIATHSEIPYIDLDNYTIDNDVLKLIPEAISRRYELIPVFKIGEVLTVALADPKNIIAIDEIRSQNPSLIIEKVLSTRTSIVRAIDKYYGTGSDMRNVVDEIHAGDDNTDNLASKRDSKDTPTADEAPMIKLVNLLLKQAVKERASDIHVESEEDMVRVRYRVDGILNQVHTYGKNLQEAIISRIKILSGLDISEKRLPQDGSFRTKIDEKDIDVRVSTFPGSFGENVVMRILDRTASLKQLKDLGFPPAIKRDFDKLIRKTYGIVLVTGPTGSGKTTTLYSAISTISSMEKNIVTVEDPIEYNVPLVRQTQVNSKIGLTFASGLRSILRQDPDIIMVGEIRDRETAEIAIQAALTGHLVFATIHTNDSTSAACRLIDMGIEPFLVSSAVIGCLAQRLVRVICPHCKTEVPISEENLAKVDDEFSGMTYRGEGCERCNEVGYLGRIGIYELFVISEKSKDMIAQKCSAEDLEKQAIEDGMTVMRQDGIAKAKKGITTIEEVLRVIHQED